MRLSTRPPGLALASASGQDPSRARETGGMVNSPQAQRPPTGAPAYAPAYAQTSATGRSTGRPISRPASQAGVAQAPQTVARAGFAALVRGWMRVLTPGAWASVHETPHPLVVRVVRWAPIFAPALVGTALLALTLALVLHMGYPVFEPLPPSQMIPVLLLAYLMGGAILGLALYFAPNGVVWTLAIVGLPSLLLVAMFTLAFGAPGAALTLSALAAVLLIYSCARRRLTRPGTVEVSLLLGEWYRVLPSGYNILLPGERAIVALRTQPQSFTTPLQRVSLTPTRVAQARATVSYAVNPREAWRTASVRATWEEELRQRVTASVRESLSEWRSAPDGDVAAHSSIAQRVLDDTRDWARSVGVRILTVRARDIVVGAPGELPPPITVRGRPTPRVDDGAYPGRGAQPPAAVVRTTLPTVQAAAVPSVAAPAERPSAEALEDLYEAVRARRITDTQVIREIASQFAALGRAPHATDTALPFDPIAAARFLDDYAEALDAARPPQRAPRR